MFDISMEELTKFQGDYEWYKKHGEGYRIVYFYSNNTYKIGTFCKNIEGFMMDFVEVESIKLKVIFLILLKLMIY